MNQKKILFYVLIMLSFFNGYAQSISIIGDAGVDWSTDVPLSTTDNINYTLDNYTLSVGTLKFRQNNDWAVNWGSGDFPSGTGTQDGADIPVNMPGIYNISLNINTGEYNFALVGNVQATISIIGDAAIDWDTDVELFSNDGINYSISNYALNVGKLKFRENKAWTVQWGSSDFPSGTGTQDGADISITTSGNYNITFNRTTGAFNFEILNADAENFGSYATAVWIENTGGTNPLDRFMNTHYESPNGFLGNNEHAIDKDLNPGFNNYDFGSQNYQSGSLILKGLEVKTYKKNQGNNCAPVLAYTTYPLGERPENPEFTTSEIGLFNECDISPKDPNQPDGEKWNRFPDEPGHGPCNEIGYQKWQGLEGWGEGHERYFAPVDLTDANEGNYELELFYKIPGHESNQTGCSDEFVDDLNGMGYRASFTVCPTFVSATSNNPTTCGGDGTIIMTMNGVADGTYNNGEFTHDGGSFANVVVVGGVATIIAPVTTSPSTTYTNVSYVNTTGCTALGGQDFTITEVTVPAAPVSGGDQVVCSITPVQTLTATANAPAGSTVVWYDAATAGNIVTPELSAIGTITYFAQSENNTTNCISTTRTPVSLTINETFQAVFSFQTTFDQGAANPPALPATSDAPNVVTGTWSPAAIDTNILGDTQYTFTPDAGQCGGGGAVVTVNVVDPSKTDPTFTLPASICTGDVAPVLPSPSDNGITGSWSPAVVDNTQSGSYLFTPDDLALNNTFSYSLTVIQLTNPTFNGLPNTIFCINDTAPVLPTTSIENITGSWSPAIDMSIAGAITYTFTPDAGQCAATATTTITVANLTTPTFVGLPNPSVSLCQNGVAPVLPVTSIENITGTWAPAIDMSAVGTVTYTFTPDAGQCAGPATTAITIEAPVTPTFSGLPDPAISLCQNSVAPVLPVTSIENITGTWAPAIDMSSVGTVTYTFTPDSGQCAGMSTTEITIVAPTTPTFTTLPDPNVILCQGGTAPTLALTSVENITGSWLPAIDMTTPGTVTYTFTPDPGQCAASTTTNITIGAAPTPTFINLPDSNTSLCQGGVAPTFPTTSVENITGSWSPAVDMTTPGTVTYTFTPDPGQCSGTATSNLTIVAPTVPTFNNLPVGPFCQGDSDPGLPTTSQENITGSWSAIDMNTPVNNLVVTFTPDPGQCASITTTNITINTPIVPTFNNLPVGPFCQAGASPVLPTTSLENITGIWSPIDMNIPGNSIVVTFTPDPGQCAIFTTTTIVIDATTVPDFTGAVTTVCQYDTSYSLPNTVNNITGDWTPNFDSSVIGATTYTFQPNDPNQCSIDTALVITVTPTPGEILLTGSCEGTDYLLTASPVNGSYDPTQVTYSWANSSGLIMGENESNYSPDVADTYTVTVSIGSCSNTESITLSTVHCMIPKGVSPDGNGANDTFNLTALEPVKVQIFNRYGYEVFERANYTNEWYGQTNAGDELPAGTYYYLIEFKSGETKTGWVYLAR